MISDGRPWAGNDDINHVTLDAVMAFALGEVLKNSMTRKTTCIYADEDIADTDRVEL